MATTQKVNKCVKCGKILKPGTKFTHKGNVYCCGTCCKAPAGAANVCEFC